MDSYGPALQSGRLSGGSREVEKVPTRTVGETTAASSVSGSESEDDCYGPALPPGLSNNAEQPGVVVGPMLPPHLMHKRQSDTSSEPGASPEHASPGDDDGEGGDGDQASGGGGDEDDDIGYGPLPPSTAGAAEADDSVQRRFEAHAAQMRKKLEPQKEELRREEWMTALPSKKKALGLGLTNRSFKNSSAYVANEDRSVWTDTPADRQRKAAEGESEKKKRKDSQREVVPESVRRSNEELLRQTEEYNKAHRGESLMALHQKKRKSDVESGVATKKTVLQPFDPERDMRPDVMLDSSARQKVISNAKKLDNRFQRSTQQSSFL